MSIAAYARSGLHAQGVQYVLCGAPEEPGHDDACAAAARTPGVIRFPYVSDTELSWLYGNASGFVLASQLEGFGMPVAEAIAYGLVPAVSAASVLEEVAGNGGLFFDPNDEEAIAACMISLVDMSKQEREARSTAMSEHIRKFEKATFLSEWRSVLEAATQSA
jgi:glycosyltransferase involved in cell wall biosynthesis